MKNYCCRVCSAMNGDVFLAKNMRHNKKEQFEYFQCFECESVSIVSIPNDLSKFYENYYSFGLVKDYDGILKKIAKQAILKKNIFNSIAGKFLNSSADLSYKALSLCNINKNSKILDVGSGTGQMVFDLYNMGYKQTVGIDPFLDTDMIYPNGCKIFQKSIFEEHDTWDVVMLNHVFEHMKEPLPVLNKLRNLLKPNGICMIRIPNIDSYAFRKFRQSWYGIQAPVHLFLPSIKAMHDLVNQANMEIYEIKGENVLEFWLHSIAYKLNIWDYDELGIRTYLSQKSGNTIPKIITKSEWSYLAELNTKICKTPSLCDWLTYYIKLK